MRLNLTSKSVGYLTAILSAHSCTQVTACGHASFAPMLCSDVPEITKTMFYKVLPSPCFCNNAGARNDRQGEKKTVL